MSHTPPVPPGNQSPYPAHEPSDIPKNKALDRLKTRKKNKEARPHTGAIVAAAFGAGILVAAAGYLFTSRAPAKKGRKRK